MKLCALNDKEQIVLTLCNVFSLIEPEKNTNILFLFTVPNTTLECPEKHQIWKQ